MPSFRSGIALVAIALAPLAAPAALADVTLSAPIDILGNLSPTDFSAYGYGTNSYKDWGNEPSVAVNPVNPSQIVVSSFGYGTNSTTAGATFFYSTDGGTSWSTQQAVPAPASGIGIPNDWRFMYDSSGTLHGAVLGGCDAACNVYHGTTTNPTSIANWSWTGGGAPINAASTLNNADQPWIALSAGKVFVGYDDFTSGTSERVTVSTNNGASFGNDNAISNTQTNSSVNPGTRIATDGNGYVYSIFGVANSTATAGVQQNVAYYLNRSRDDGATWDFTASSSQGGIQLPTPAGAQTLSTQLCNPCTQSSNNWFAGVNDLRGNTTAIASDATGSHVYAVYGMQDSTGTDRLYLVELHPSGGSLAASTPIAISVAGQRAAMPSVTVTADGTVVVMYDTYSAADGKVHVHVATSADFGASVASDVEEYSFTPLSLFAATGSTTANREFGDYQFITSVGNNFYGAFAGVGNTVVAADTAGAVGSNTTTSLVSPFFFSGTSSVPEPASAAMLIAGLAGLGALRRRR